jgi:uncharacterized protein with HEPN domain
MNAHEKDIVRVRHMLDAIATLDKYLVDRSREDFFSDELLINMAARQISIVGEAMDALSQEFRSDHPGLPYRDAKDMRNFLIHEYFDVTDKALWETYEKNIPDLKRQLDEVLEKEA